MSKPKISENRFHRDDILYVYLKSNVLKVGRYQGTVTNPVDRSEKSFCIGLEPRGLIYEWIKPQYIHSVEVVSDANVQNNKE